MTCLCATCEPRTINLSITGERITFYNVASQPRTSDRLACHWRALSLLAYDNWRCSIQPEIFHSLKVLSRAGFDLGSTAGESSTLITRLHMLYSVWYGKVLFNIMGVGWGSGRGVVMVWIGG